MHHLPGIKQDSGMITLPEVKNPQFIVFSDLDETYLANQPNEEHTHYLRQLENFIINDCAKKSILFGWVTGCTVPSILSKLDKYNLRVLPHFIAHSLATELVYFNINNPDGEHDTVWQNQLLHGEFKRETIEEIVNELFVGHHIFLEPQKAIYNTKCKVSYYYRKISEELDSYAIGKIKEAANKYQIAVNISQCNPLLGDPADCYDVNCIPHAAGKSQIVKYLIEKYKVLHENTFAFGDSQGDVEMLRAVKFGYLVANAQEVAKKNFNSVTKKPYAQGILEIIQGHLTPLSR